jgi:hypothetical protein
VDLHLLESISDSERAQSKEHTAHAASKERSIFRYRAQQLPSL